MKRKINGGHLIIFIFIISIIYFCLKDVFIKNEIEKDGIKIIVKFTSKVKLPKTTNFYFTYFINGKKINTANSGIDYSISNSKSETDNIKNLKINSFYLAKYIPEKPNIICVDPLKQITDTIAILEAGFTKADIEFKK